MLLRRNLFALCPFYLQSRFQSDYFISTPIFYVNASPHIGHLYSALLADASHRFNVLLGKSTVFSTGTDEHGTKIQQAASALKVPLPDYCSQISSQFENLFKKFAVDYSQFIRTTDSAHKSAVKHFWNGLVSKGHISPGNYSGWYCDADEAFLTENQMRTIIDKGKEIYISAESGRPVKWVEEKNYRFNLARFEKDLRYWLKKDDSVRPFKFKTILLQLIDDGIMSGEVSVSRPASRVHWGIPVPNDDSQTIYVWLDALVNYLTAAGYPGQLKRWPPVQVIGKDILKFHGIYWPAFLIANDLEPPSMLQVHSHWTINDEKMSKSRGNVVCPLAASEVYTTSGLRYFLLREGTPHSDSNYTDTKVLRILNAELADTLGNLLSRSCGNSVNKKQEFPPFVEEDFEKYCKELATDLVWELNSLREEVKQHYEEFNFYRGISYLVSTLHSANRFFELSKPWELRKSASSREHLDCVLHITLETLRICGIALQPIVPQLATSLLNKMSIPTSARTWAHLTPSWVSNTRQSYPLNKDQVILYKRILAI